MPVVRNDLPSAISTRYEVLFNQAYNTSVAVDAAVLSGIAFDARLEDHQGKTINLNWLGAAPQMRKWLDEKRAQGLNKFNYDVTVERYEASIEIDMDAFYDARFAIYDSRIKEMGQNASRLVYNMVSDLIKNGSAATCYDGQFFFDTDHSEGDSGVQSNLLTGTGTSAAQITTDFYTALTAINGFKDDKGVPLQPSQFRPIVWIPNNATVVQRFKELQKAEMISTTDNILVNSFDLVIDPRLTDTNDWYMFRSDGILKPFIVVKREDPSYKDNFSSRADDVFMRRIGVASVEARCVAAYGMWQQAAKITNA